GREVGPDLAALRDKSTEALLVAILDPNRAVLDRYVQYVVTTTEDRTLSGRIESESDNALVLVTVDGTRATLLRSEVKSQVSTGRSLMPEGLEAAIDRDRMADLIAFLQQPALARKQCAGNTPATIVPAADGSLALTAATAEIYGGALVFEAALQNLGCWHGSDDHAVWTLDLPAARTFAVELEWACADAAAGNEFVVSAGNARLTGKVAATGPGWDRYQRQAVGELQLPAGKVRLELRPAGPLRSALLDLRALHLLPK
ncbi:MAG TPA: dehydrogenase, partial [Planctomycetota bacterium]|nr:dehydrogenase [Planctomycetota bacterium]